VPAYNEERTIKKVIENLKRLDYPKRLLKILVIDDGSTDNTAKLAKETGAQVVTKRNEGKARALNFGIKLCKSEIVVVVDADSYPEKDALIKSIPFFEEDDVMAVTTKILVSNKNNFLEKIQLTEYAIISWIRKLSEFIEAIYVTPGPFALYRRSVFNSIGYFDTNNATEDIEMAWRILGNNYKIRMSLAKVTTDVPGKWKAWIRQRVRWNVGGIQTAAKYKSYMFRKGSGSFKYYVIPFFTMSYFVGFLALSLFIYLAYMWVYNNIVYVLSAYLMGINPFKNFIFMIIPDTLVFFSVFMLAVAFLMIFLGLRSMKVSAKNRVYILFYLTVYITIFPFLLAYSFYKYLRGYEEW
jgi:cellulose synthase/poly-beta-1,6-N-acetylglucosamine synthase-like glycosyltransferase